MKIKRIIVIGLGEIGSSWFKIISGLNANILGVDIKEKREINNQNINDGKTIMHICIPYIKDFENVSSSYIRKYKPDLIIVNTTCQVGSTRRIYENEGVNIVHIPVRGIHPDIDQGIKTFVNAIGPINKESADISKEYLSLLNIKYDLFNNPEETELAKLLDTTYYGWNILFAKQTYELCKENKLDYENVYTKFNKTYNEGYSKLGKNNVIRPVLIPPQIFNEKLGLKNKRINGHCVRTNLEILKTLKKSRNIKFIDYAIDLDDSK